MKNLNLTEDECRIILEALSLRAAKTEESADSLELCGRRSLADYARERVNITRKLSYKIEQAKTSSSYAASFSAVNEE